MDRAHFIARCECGMLLKVFNILDDLECPKCGGDVGIAVNHHRQVSKPESFRWPVT